MKDRKTVVNFSYPSAAAMVFGVYLSALYRLLGLDMNSSAIPYWLCCRLLWQRLNTIELTLFYTFPSSFLKAEIMAFSMMGNSITSLPIKTNITAIWSSLAANSS